MTPEAPELLRTKPSLRRELGPVAVTLSGVGIILGAGIYALLGEATGLAGNAVWLTFAISALIAGFTALSYAELSSMYPRASAEYEYVSNAIGRKVAFVVGWLIILSGIFGVATVSLGFGGYFSDLTGAPLLPSAVGIILVLAVILLYGIRETAWVAITMTLIEAAGIVMIILIGLPHLGSVDYLAMPLGLSGVLQASALVFFAYMGFEEMVKLSEEARDPVRTVPKALILALAITTVLYILASLAAVSVVGWEQLAASRAPFADVAYIALGDVAFTVIGVIALFATANTALMMLLAASRITYGMADAFSLPAVLARVSLRTRTPWVAILAIMLAAIVFVFAGEITFVANVTNFTLFLTFIVINAAVILLRLRAPDEPRPFCVPGSVGRVPVLPLLGVVTSLALLGQLDPTVLLVGCVLAVLGIALSFVELRGRSGG
ncbi:amino acid permease [Methanoculleus sp. FWC-SCC1]|uniref:Amino acid permease n=1 Tax=Methanoculleus frigidifontis TaxID=2584085 RepID=A0ABT8M8D7_9EURY|nr:amino acid permease [Methanoculleus sp. FWC-SCC1]MDN7024191.1 amino acid permease [Methanoculleus sp. FWC-SCC1]